MNKNFLILITTLTLSALPAFADTSDATNSDQIAAPVVHHKSLIKKVVGVVVGTVIGVPVCVVRKPIDEEKYEMKSWDCDKHKPLFVITVAGLWLPFAATEGILEAPFFAANNSLVNCNKPFSKEQFSLVETMEQAQP